MTALIRLGDVVFVTGWLGVISLLVMLDLALASRILSGAHPDRLLVAAAKIFWPTAAIWLVFTAWMLTHCVRTHRLNREERRTWIATMLLNIVIVGPTAYYVASYRTGRSRPPTLITVSSRRVLDILYVSSFWGSIGFVGLFLGVLTLPVTPTALMAAMTLGLAIVPIAAVSTAVLSSLLLMDAVARSAGANREYLRLLNPWSWIFGLRRYYLDVLRPTLR